MKEILKIYKMQLKRLLREFVVTKKEEKLIAFGAVMINTVECFDGYQGSSIAQFEIPGGLYSLSDIYVRYGDYKFGYIQNIEFNRESGIAYIGHIATTVDCMGLGIARRFIYAFAACAKADFGVKEIHFCESSASGEKFSLYDNFFTQKLGAVRVSHKFGYKWVWQVPDELDAECSFFKRHHNNSYINLPGDRRLSSSAKVHLA